MCRTRRGYALVSIVAEVRDGARSRLRRSSVMRSRAEDQRSIAAAASCPSARRYSVKAKPSSVPSSESNIAGRSTQASAAGQAVEHLRLLVGGGEECAIAPQDVDVAGHAETRVFDIEVELETERFEFFGLIVSGELPDIALCGEKGRADGVERAQSAAKRRIVIGLGDFGDVVRI